MCQKRWGGADAEEQKCQKYVEGGVEQNVECRSVAGGGEVREWRYVLSMLRCLSPEKVCWNTADTGSPVMNMCIRNAI